MDDKQWKEYKRNNSRFQPSSPFGGPGGTYICRMCGKRTRETGQDESSCGLCKSCFNECNMENEHSDGYHDDNKRDDCPDCKAVD
jgi:hypothetical protein